MDYIKANSFSLQAQPLIKAVRNAIQDANSLKSGIADWSYLCDKATYNDVYREAFLHSYDEYRQEIWGATYMNLLGKYLMSCNDQKTHILEIGSSKCMTIKNMTKGNHDSEFEYISIDRATESNCFGSKHIKADVFDASEFDLSHDYRFDILIIDVEPHGKEIEIYEKFAKYGAPHHVVILKCVGFIDLVGLVLLLPPVHS